MLVIEAITLRGQPMAEPIHATFDEHGGTIGRGSASTLQLPDSERHVSRTHATIGYRDGGFVITHTGTLNPLTLNGCVLSAGGHAPLKDGDEIKVGPYRLRAKIQGEPQQAPPPAVASADSQSPVAESVEQDSPAVLGSGSVANNPDPSDDTPLAPEPPVLTDVVVLPPWQASSGADEASAIPLDSPPVAAMSLASRHLDIGTLPPQSRFHPLPETEDVNRLFDLMKGRRVEPSLSADWLPKASSHMRSGTRSRAFGAYEYLETRESASQPRPETDLDRTPPLPPEPCVENAEADAGLSDHADSQEADSAPPAEASEETLYVARQAIAEAQSAEPVPAPESLSAADLPHRLAEAFLRGARVKDVKFANGITPEIMESLGQMMRESVQGTLDLLSARTAVKAEIQSSGTVIVQRDNNPLKFSPTAEIALSHLLEPKGHGFLSPVRAIQDAYSDLRGHQQAVLAGMNAATAGVLLRLCPQQLENQGEQRSMLDNFLPIARKARQWDLFTERYRDLSSEVEDDCRVVFSKEFRRAYEAQLVKSRSTETNQPRR